MKKPKELFAVVCESGMVFMDEEDEFYVATTYWGAEQYLEILAHGGSRTCECDRHRIVVYVPKAPEKVAR